MGNKNAPPVPETAGIPAVTADDYQLHKVRWGAIPTDASVVRFRVYLRPRKNLVPTMLASMHKPNRSCYLVGGETGGLSLALRGTKLVLGLRGRLANSYAQLDTAHPEWPTVEIAFNVTDGVLDGASVKVDGTEFAFFAGKWATLAEVRAMQEQLWVNTECVKATELEYETNKTVNLKSTPLEVQHGVPSKGQ